MLCARLCCVLIISAFIASASVSDVKELFSWASVDYDWTGSPWSSREEAIQSGAFVVANNIVTGIGVYSDEVFVCIPRWRHGVPATLNRLVGDGPSAVLQPYPSWWYNLNRLNYVQSMWIDQARGWMFIIDTGRENFFDSNASYLVNTHAKLLIYDMNMKDEIYFHEFPDEIFPLNNSFLNDIVVDAERQVAYMSDTNVAGRGALVMLNFSSGFSVRFEDPSTYPNPYYQVEVLNVSYGMDSPCDGIALSEDGKRLYYSPIKGASLYKLDATMFSNPSSTHADIVATVKNLTEKRSFSDGLRVMPSSSPNTDVLFYGWNAAAGLCKAEIDIRTRHVEHDTVYQDAETMLWLDSFADVTINATHSYLYFTTNKLQLYFVGKIDPGIDNFRVFRLLWEHE